MEEGWKMRRRRESAKCVEIVNKVCSICLYHSTPHTLYIMAVGMQCGTTHIIFDLRGWGTASSKKIVLVASR